MVECACGNGRLAMLVAAGVPETEGRAEGAAFKLTIAGHVTIRGQRAAG